MPLEPDFFATGVSPSSTRTSCSRSATRAHSTIVVPGPGSRSNTIRSGGRRPGPGPTVHCGTCSSSAARFAAQISGQLIQQHVVDRVATAARPAAGQARGAQPARGTTRNVLLEGLLPAHTVGESGECHRPGLRGGQQQRRDAAVEVDHLALGEAVRVQRLVQIGQRESALAHLHGYLCRCPTPGDGHRPPGLVLHVGLLSTRIRRPRSRRGGRGDDLGDIAVIAQPAPRGVAQTPRTPGELAVDDLADQVRLHPPGPPDVLTRRVECEGWPRRSSFSSRACRSRRSCSEKPVPTSPR
jgi:hypothetical protein